MLNLLHSQWSNLLSRAVESQSQMGYIHQRFPYGEGH